MSSLVIEDNYPNFQTVDINNYGVQRIDIDEITKIQTSISLSKLLYIYG